MIMYSALLVCLADRLAMIFMLLDHSQLAGITKTVSQLAHVLLTIISEIHFYMNAKLSRLFIHGFPSLYGGAGTELHHQILIWHKMGIQIHLIPCYMGYEHEPLYHEMLALGVIIHAPNDWSVLQQDDAIMGFCNGAFLSSLEEIRRYTKRTIFVNCMTWLFDQEKECMRRGLISMFLYQNEAVLDCHQPALRALNTEAHVEFRRFKPYFHKERFPFIARRDEEFFGCGRISRQDADKFARNTLHIYEYFVAPQFKRGLFLGFSNQSEQKIGPVMDWISTAADHTVVSQQDFYRHCRIILQPTDTAENWPRIGFEAMASGSVLIVDNRGGWQQLVEHGKTGWLCDHERDFIYYASKMAYEPNMRDDMATAAYQRALQLGGEQASRDSWEQIFEAIAKLPI